MSGICLITGTSLLRLGAKLVKGFMRTPEQAAATHTYLALSPEELVGLEQIDPN